MHVLTKRTLRLFGRNAGLQLKKLIGNPFMLFTIVAATFGTVELFERITERIGVVVIPFSVLIFLIFVYFHFREKIDIFPEKPVTRERYTAIVPFDIRNADHYNDVFRVIQECQKIFGSAALDPDDDLKSWRSDPYSMVILKAGSEIVGFLDYYFFRRPDFERFLNREIDFHQLHRECTLPHPKARQAEVMYVGTIVHFDYVNFLRSDTQYSNEVAYIVEGAIDAILKHQEFGEGGVDVYSSGWSHEGRRLLVRHDFEKDDRYRPRWLEMPIYRRLGLSRRDVEDLRKSFSIRRRTLTKQLGN